MRPSVLHFRSWQSAVDFAILFLSVSLFVKLLCVSWLLRSSPSKLADLTVQRLDIPDTKPVLIPFDNSVHFRLDTGRDEWSSIVPQNGVVHLEPSGEPYTVSMFHQLQCLSVIRSEITRNLTENPHPSELGRHCLNYVRQMILCRGDLHIQPFQHASSHNPVDLNGVYTCRDWGVVYDTVLKNQGAHTA